ncbi:MAG TPA: class I SAM-dependent methyltransferase [Acholeplasmataceae bacterium]|jgi:16S rRNA (guanine1207-N2)-methyltransferase|nr:class I SAM-dependent methyltransferase [Acholeplasmataceae bacterium]
MSHYFINDENLKSNEFTFDYDYFNNKLKFISDYGVFSKNRVDFGTHLLLNSFTSIPEGLCLDLGCGIGVIGLALAKQFKKCFIHMVDINKRALSLATKNAKLNNIDNCKIYESNLYDNINDTFDLIVSNPPIRAGKKIVHQIIDDGYSKLNNDGFIYIVIQKKQGAPSLIKKMEEVFGNVEIINKKNGYYVIVSKKET